MTLHRIPFRWLAALALATVTSGAAWAQADIRTENIQFDKGTSSAAINGRITGYQLVDYLIGARKGQAAEISLATKHGATYFNIMAPGQTEVAFFNGSTSQNQYKGLLPEDGTYRVRVYMMRSAARRNETADYRLDVAITGNAKSTQAPARSTDAKVAGTDFHATGNLPCAMGGGRPTGSCSFGVKREGQGNGMVEVTKPDGRKRVIFFEKGRATGYDASQADQSTFNASRQSDLNIVRIGEERYEIPDAIINGG